MAEANVTFPQTQQETLGHPSTSSTTTDTVLTTVPVEVGAWKRKQMTTRRQITITCKIVEERIAEKGSRREIMATLGEAKRLLAVAEQLNDQLAEELTDQKEFDEQQRRHLFYISQVSTIEELAEQYIAERVNDAPSVVSQPQGPRLRQQSFQEDQSRAEQPLPSNIAEQRVEDSVREIEGVVGPATEPIRPIQRGSQLESAESDNGWSRNREVSQWLDHYHRPARTLAPSAEPEDTPDAWIDSYRAGRDQTPKTRAEPENRSSVKIELEVFSGKSLDWFWWVDLFHALVHQSSRSPAEKLAILKRQLQDDAADVVYGLVGGEEAYKEALFRLKENFGRRDVMRAAHQQALERLEMPKGDPKAFRRFAERARTHLFDLSRIGETNHSDIIEKLSQRLTLNDRLAWNNGRDDRLAPGMDLRTLNQFGAWLCSRAAAYQNAYSIASDQLSGANLKTKNVGFSAQPKPRQQGQTHHGSAIADAMDKPKPKEKSSRYCFKCEREHQVEACPEFKDLPVGERVTFCIRHRLCFMCFGVKHSSRDCRFKKMCSVPECKLFHHPLLHASSRADSNSCSNTLRSVPRTVALGVIRIDAVNADGGLVPINVMFDEGSDSTLIRQGLVSRLGLDGIKQTLEIDGIGGTHSRISSERLQMTLQTSSGEKVVIQGSTIPTVTKPVPLIDWSNLRKRWDHLADLPLRCSGGQVDVLLGLDHPHLMAVMEARKGKDYEPIASRTRLGWVVRGVVGKDTTIGAKVHLLFTSETANDVGPELIAAMRAFCDTESFGTEHQVDCMSPENRRALSLLDSQTKKLTIGYEVPILWREGEPSLPNNWVLAESRNRSLRNRFQRDPGYEREYRAAMQTNFNDGYARRLSAEEQPGVGPVYYLSHFGVQKSPGSKIRVVFDAAAKFRGRCLNDSICSGPALQNPLPAVIIKFREGKIAWAADIKAMFSRIRLQPEDRRFHRFIWPEEDGTDSVCEMTRLTFGVNCSPFIAIRTTWRAADDAGPTMKEAAAAVRANLYVDDYLGSSKDVESGIRIATAVREVLAGGDFHLQGWTSNSADLRSSLQAVSSGIEESTHSFGADETEMVLGVIWKPHQDTLGFKISGLDNVVYTRVGLISKVASIFDPQGAASPITMKGKARLRELGVKGFDWNTEVAGEERHWWQQWFSTLQQLQEIEFPRCIFPDEERVTRVELHTFCDASEEAYATVTYIRNVYEDGSIIVRQVKASNKLAPTKTLSIPKLELNAALLGAWLADFVKRALTRVINSRYFWTDSSTVRNWVRATASFYQVFVSHRVGEIQSLTEPQEWRFVPGKINPADAVTRSQLESEAIPISWLDGPEFLYQAERCWPKDLPWMVVTEEIRPSKIHSMTARPNFDWESLELSPDNIPALLRLENEYLELIQQCQQEAYAEELGLLKNGNDVRSSSSLRSLTPILDKDGLLRLGGRIGKVKLPYDNVHPILLPGRHTFARKIIVAFHEYLKHAGTDFLLTQIRQHLWITEGREAVKRVKRDCLRCRRYNARPASQLMGELPVYRLEIGAPPFTRSACDYFGPLEIIYARNRVAKRWGALFTCLVTRAVYLDLAASLSSGDFLFILRRFIGLYGKPRSLHSDNGTNFVGAERLLREEVDALHATGEAHQFMKKEGIDWHFEPACTPHFGGAHEALVRFVKKALYAALEIEKGVLRHPTEDMLRTLLFEVAGLLNSRPLTYASSDPDDLRPLTPNDFLNRPPAANLPVGEFQDALPRENYRYVQRMTNLFWDLWKGTYLQSLAGRKK